MATSLRAHLPSKGLPWLASIADHVRNERLRRGRTRPMVQNGSQKRMTEKRKNGGKVETWDHDGKGKKRVDPCPVCKKMFGKGGASTLCGLARSS